MLYFGLTNALFLLRYMLAGAQDSRRQIYYTVLLGLFVFSAFRFQVGCDWSGYYYEYLAAENMDWPLIAGRREPIWWAILISIHKMGLPYPVANIISSGVFFVGIHTLARRQPDPLGFLVLLFPILIINMPMSGIRQGAAIGLICIAFVAFLDRRPMWFTLWVLTAAGFHLSALVFLLLFPLVIGRYSNTRLLMAAMLAAPGAFLLFSSEAGDLASSRYIGTDVEAFGGIFRTGLLALSASYFFLFARKKWGRLFPQDYPLVNIGAIGMVLSFFLVPVSSVIADRLGYYLIPIQAMFFARIPYLNFNFNKSFHSAIPYLGLIVVFFVWSQLSEHHFQRCYIPYNSWLLGLPSGDLLK
jgi:hypothetical protein